ncbi:hypothetical protein R8543_18675 [Klebsiella oxytoca]|uniref:hypothetical protein n=1 Tax=Klebsiella oxytoca TaxID=571 RepID=UPI0029CA0F79|nr:hypothetical protein [Klebsiella oxytoca]WPI63085.1 hypothetical protein R8543_18675 [Klebsiella oxytoca]
MQMITRKKPAFTELYQTGFLTRIVAVKISDRDGWRLFGFWRDKDIGVYVEAARGGVREWSGLDYLANFCGSCGISRWEVHSKVETKAPQ